MCSRHRAIGKKGFWGASYIIFHISKSYFKKKKKKTRVYGQKPIPSFRPRTLAGHLPSYVDMSGKFSGKCRAYTHQNGSGHIHGGDRYLKNGIESRVQNLSIAAGTIKNLHLGSLCRLESPKNQNSKVGPGITQLPQK